MTRPCRKGPDYAQDLCENETFYRSGRLMSLPYSDFFDSLTRSLEGGGCTSMKNRTINRNFAIILLG